MDNSSPKIYTEFLPISRADMEARGWDQLDFVVVGGDAYVDHPSFGTAIISRLLEAEGLEGGRAGPAPLHRLRGLQAVRQAEVRLLHWRRQRGQHGQPLFRGQDPPRRGRIFSRRQGRCPPGPQRHRVHQTGQGSLPDLPVILGGLEASLRRFAHYDYWMDTVLPSIAESSGADIISFGMGEHQTVEIARRLAAGEPVEQITDVDGTCYLTDFDHLPERYVECAGFKKVASDKTAYAKACRIQMDNQDVVSGQIIVQKQSEKYLVQNIPAKPLVRWELDKVYALPLHPPVSPHLRGHGRRARHPGGTVLHHPEPRLLRRLQLLRHPAASGPPGHQPQCGQHRGGSRAHDPRAGFQGLHPRCRRSPPPTSGSRPAASRCCGACAMAASTAWPPPPAPT